MQKKLTWVLAHEPYNLFLRAAEQFSQEIKAGTNERYTIDVIGLDEYNSRSDSARLTTHAGDRVKVVNLVDQGTIDMATVYVNTLGTIDKNMWVLSMPFLFADHDHATQVIDGEIGRSLFDGLSSKSNLKGLAFTYSGGFRMIPSVTAIESVRDFYNLAIRTGTNPVALDTFRAVGANPVGMLIDQFREAMNNNEVQAGETTYPRFFSMGHHEQAKYINHTEHSLFLTGIVMNKRLWADMSAEDQAVFAEAAVSAAQVERLESLADIERVQTEASAMNIPTITMSSAERQKFIDSTKTIYSKYDTFFDNGVLDGIVKLH